MRKLIAAALFIFTFSGCSDTIVTYTDMGTYQSFSVPAVEYSDNHYLIDTLYKNSFIDVFGENPLALLQSTMNNSVMSSESSFEVWAQLDTSFSGGRTCVATTMLYEEPEFGYDDSLKNMQVIRGHRQSGYFRKLHPTEYVAYPYAGFISLKINLPNSYAVGVTYRTFDGKLFGTPSTTPGISSMDTLILKMIKAPDPDPMITRGAWELRLKNIYRLPYVGIERDGFQLDVTYESGGTDLKILPGMQLSISTITKLDRYFGTSRNEPPDGQFDFFPGYTVNTETGDIIFPVLRPFSDEIASQPGGSSYDFPELYAEKKLDLQNLSIARKYFLKGRVRID